MNTGNLFKSTGFKPGRRTSGAGQASSPPAQENKPAEQNTGGTADATVSTAAQRRRSSTSEKFAGLNSVKRSSIDNQTKAKWEEQKPGGQGVLGSMWSSFTKGS